MGRRFGRSLSDGFSQVIAMAGRIALRSFHDTKARLLRMRCTMQVCTTVCGNTDVIAFREALEPINHRNENVVDAASVVAQEVRSTILASVR
jgi:hypothetical protein